jgi:hypothetical protein
VVDSKDVRSEQDLCATTEGTVVQDRTVQIESRPDQDVFEGLCSPRPGERPVQSSDGPPTSSLAKCTGGNSELGAVMWVGADAPITANTVPEGVIQMLPGSEGSMHVLLPFWCECKLRPTTNNNQRWSFIVSKNRPREHLSTPLHSFFLDYRSTPQD